jgi:hypothetical protein
MIRFRSTPKLDVGVFGTRLPRSYDCGVAISVGSALDAKAAQELRQPIRDEWRAMARAYFRLAELADRKLQNRCGLLPPPE